MSNRSGLDISIGRTYNLIGKLTAVPIAEGTGTWAWTFGVSNGSFLFPLLTKTHLSLFLRSLPSCAPSPGSSLSPSSSTSAPSLPLTESQLVDKPLNTKQIRLESLVQAFGLRGNQTGSTLPLPSWRFRLVSGYWTSLNSSNPELSIPVSRFS